MDRLPTETIIKTKKALMVAVVFLFSATAAYSFFSLRSLDKLWQSIPTVNNDSLAKKKISFSNEAQLQEKVAQIIAQKDFTQCDRITDQIYKASCINSIALNLAQESQDLIYCQKIESELLKKECETAVILKKSIEKDDVNVCSETADESLQKSCQNYFWRNQALNKEDIKLCENIATDEAKTFCHDKYLMEKQFLSDQSAFDCGLLRNVQIKSDCQTYKKNLKKTGPDRCAGVKSNLFMKICSNITL